MQLVWPNGCWPVRLEDRQTLELDAALKNEVGSQRVFEAGRRAGGTYEISNFWRWVTRERALRDFGSGIVSTNHSISGREDLVTAPYRHE